MKRNAVILAAGCSRRFAPLSDVVPKGLLIVKGEVLVERQIRQLREAGIEDIVLVTGYKAHMFRYLHDKFGVQIIENSDYSHYNNTASMMLALPYLSDTYLCSVDDYFPVNPFTMNAEPPYYAALFASGETTEWCLATDAEGRINNVTIGGKNAWYMMGHVHFDPVFSKALRRILPIEFRDEKTRQELWEEVYKRHLKELSLYLKKYAAGEILEFDSLAELKDFDSAYDRDVTELMKEYERRFDARL